MTTNSTSVLTTLTSTSQKTAHLELTSRCRLLCTKCCRTEQVENRTHRNVDISLDVIDAYARSDFEKIILCGNYGDPIYHPDFIQIVSILKKHNKSLHIHTNGSGKDLNFWNELFCLLNDKDCVWFALDGTKETAGVYRRNFSEKDFDNVQEVMALGVNQYKLNIVWIFIAFNFNEHQIDDAKKLALQNNVIFCLRKSARWKKDDPLLPSPQFQSRNTIFK